jgi:crotonobetainyl-CoA:carnitine CoA-transferase CaiB-like acyl-CoA transferase
MAGLLLHRLGAQVTRVGDEPAPDPKDADGILKESLDYGKARLATSAKDLTKEDVKALLRGTDAILDDRSLSHWLGLGVNLRALYEVDVPPRAFWCGITPYGLVGAGAGFTGTELTFQASGPMMIRIGEANRNPLPIKGPQAEIGAAWHAALLLAAQLLHGTGGGALLDVSIQECQYMHSELGVSNWHFNGMELGWTRFAPQQNPYLFNTLDGQIHMLFHDREWPRVAKMIGREDLASDTRFMARYERAKHMEEFDALVTPWFLERTSAEAVEAGQAVGMPLAFAQPADEVLRDPQLLHREAFESLTVAGRGLKFPVGIGRILGADLPVRRDESQPSTVRLQDFVDAGPDRGAEKGLPGQDFTKPLKGIRIVDLTNTWAGPRAATLLGDLGAEVIKVEGIEWMDMLRGFTVAVEGNRSYPRSDPGDRPWDRYIMWLGLARNKESLALELTHPDGRAVLDELIASADVLVTNMSASTRAKHRLEYEQLLEVNPRIVFAVLSGYGDDGPRASWRLFGDGQASLASLFHGTGYPDGRQLSFGAYGDPVNGTAFALQVVAGLMVREQTGRGVRVDVSAVETCLTYSVRSLIEAQLGLDSTNTVGVDAGDRWPHGVYRCLGEEAWVAISCGSDRERSALYEGLLAAAGGLDAAQTGDWAPSDWDRAIDEVCKKHEPASIEWILRSRGVPCQRVMRARDVDGDSILTSRGFIDWLWREDLGSYPSYAAYWLINGTRPAITQPPARFGEHNEYVLSELLHKTTDEIAALRRNRVIGERPVEGAELGIRPSQMAEIVAETRA